MENILTLNCPYQNDPIAHNAHLPHTKFEVKYKKKLKNIRAKSINNYAIIGIDTSGRNQKKKKRTLVTPR